jgi:hypothetical protein
MLHQSNHYFSFFINLTQFLEMIVNYLILQFDHLFFQELASSFEEPINVQHYFFISFH